MLELVENPDVIGSLGAIKGGRFVVGFALEAGPRAVAVDRARAKLVGKHLDLCVLNSLDAMGATDNTVTLVWADGEVEDLPSGPKQEVGAQLVDRVLVRAGVPGGRTS